MGHEDDRKTKPQEISVRTEVLGSKPYLITLGVITIVLRQMASDEIQCKEFLNRSWADTPKQYISRKRNIIIKNHIPMTFFLVILMIKVADLMRRFCQSSYNCSIS